MMPVSSAGGSGRSTQVNLGSASSDPPRSGTDPAGPRSVDDEDLQDHDPDPDAAVDERDAQRQQAAAMRGQADGEAPQEQLHEADQERRTDGEIDRHAEESRQTPG